MKSRSNACLALVKIKPHMQCLASLKKPDEFILRVCVYDDVCDCCLSEYFHVLVVQGLRINIESKGNVSRTVDLISLRVLVGA